jgi:hypothetical protein
MTSLFPERAQATAQDSCQEVSRRVERLLSWRTESDSLLYIAFEHLARARAALYASILDPRGADLETATLNAALAVNHFRQSGSLFHLPHGLLTRAWLRATAGQLTGSDSAQSDLDEAWEVAELGPMPLLLADVHLHRCRFFRTVTPYPWAANGPGPERAPSDDLAAARDLVERFGYGRRKNALAAAAGGLNSVRVRARLT